MNFGWRSIHNGLSLSCRSSIFFTSLRRAKRNRHISNKTSFHWNMANADNDVIFSLVVKNSTSLLNFQKFERKDHIEWEGKLFCLHSNACIYVFWAIVIFMIFIFHKIWIFYVFGMICGSCICFWSNFCKTTFIFLKIFKIYYVFKERIDIVLCLLFDAELKNLNKWKGDVDERQAAQINLRNKSIFNKSCVQRISFSFGINSSDTFRIGALFNGCLSNYRIRLLQFFLFIFHFGNLLTPELIEDLNDS